MLGDVRRHISVFSKDWGHDWIFDDARLGAEFGVDLEVAREHAWAFAARGVRATEIRNIYEVSRLVLEARRAGDWRKEWVIVSELRRVDHLTVLVARSKHAKGKIRAKAKDRRALRCPAPGRGQPRALD